MCFVLFSNNFTKQLSIYHITHIQFLLDTSFAVSFFVTEDMSEKNVEVWKELIFGYNKQSMLSAIQQSEELKKLHN